MTKLPKNIAANSPSLIFLKPPRLVLLKGPLSVLGFLKTRGSKTVGMNFP